MRRSAILGIFALGALVLVATVSAASGPKATGGVWWTGGASNQYVIHAVFTAQGDAATAKGNISLWAYDAGTGALEIAFRGDVTCYYQDGNFARFSGMVDPASRVGPYKGGHFEIAVQDNGEGGSASPDMIGTKRVATVKNPGQCGDMTAPKPISTGNLQVH